MNTVNAKRVASSVLFFSPLVCFALVVFMLKTETECPIVFGPIHVDLKEVIIVGDSPPRTDGKIKLIKVRKFQREKGSARKPLKLQEKKAPEVTLIKVPKSDMIEEYSEPYHRMNQDESDYEFEVK